MTTAIEITLCADTTVRRWLDERDRVEIEHRGTRVILHVDAASVGVAAEIGASLLASARRQTERDK